MRKETALLAIFLAILTIGLLYGFGPSLAATPTPVKVTELTPVTTVTPNTQLYIIQDPTGTPVSRRTSVEAAVHAGILPISIDGLNIVIGGNVQITGTTSISGTTIVSDTLTVDTLTLPDHIHDGTANSGGAFDAANLASGTAITNTVLTADGAGLTSWLTPTTQIHDHSSDSEGGAFDAANLASGSATDGYVLTADGAGGAEWEATTGSSGGYTQGCRVFNDTSITLSNGVETALTFNSERYDTDTMHSTVSATNRITITTSGVYFIWGNITFSNNTSGVRAAYIYANGSTILARVQADAVANSSGATVIQISSVYYLETGSYLELRAEQNCGGNLDVMSNAQYSPEFAAQRIG